MECVNQSQGYEHGTPRPATGLSCGGMGMGEMVPLTTCHLRKSGNLGPRSSEWESWPCLPPAAALRRAHPALKLSTIELVLDVEVVGGKALRVRVWRNQLTTSCLLGRSVDEGRTPSSPPSPLAVYCRQVSWLQGHGNERTGMCFSSCNTHKSTPTSHLGGSAARVWIHEIAAEPA